MRATIVTDFQFLKIIILEAQMSSDLCKWRQQGDLLAVTHEFSNLVFYDPEKGRALLKKTFSFRNDHDSIILSLALLALLSLLFLRD